MRVDMHVHTRYSRDSRSDPRILIKVARRRGLDGFLVADHDSLGIMREFRDLSSDDFRVFPGVELSVDGGHLIIVGDLDPRAELPETLDDAREFASDNDAAVIVPHPFSPYRKGLGRRGLRLADALEVLNSRELILITNLIAKIVARRGGLGMTGGSDSHTPVSVGIAYTIFDDWIDEIDDLVAILRSRRGYRPAGRILTPIEALKELREKYSRRGEEESSYQLPPESS